MESPLSPSHVVIAYDATKDRGVHELKLTIDAVRMRGDILRGGDTLVVHGVLHRVLHPCKCLIFCLGWCYITHWLFNSFHCL
jgi:interleukin-1 receptor-associated kinase 1